MHTDAFAYFDGAPLAIAHRGGAHLPANEGRENTVAAFRSAEALGFTHFETDVHASRDGVLFAFHDAEFARVAGVDAKIAELSAREISQITVGGEPVPQLQELFAEFPSAFFNIDIKAANAVTPLARTIDLAGAHHRVCVASFSTSRLEEFRALAGPEIATSMTPREVLVAAYAPRLPRVLDWLSAASGLVAQVPLTYQVGPLAVPVLTPRLLAMAHACGKHVHAWTIDDVDTMRRLIDAGIDGIMTDRPDRLVEVLPQ